MCSLFNVLVEVALRDPASGGRAYLVRDLIEEVRLIFGNGGLTIELRGHLASILALSNGSKETQPTQQRALQIKMVAGI